MTSPVDLNVLYAEFFERGVAYFLKQARIEILGPAPVAKPLLDFFPRADGCIELDWCGNHYLLHHSGRPFTENQIRLVAAIGIVLSARYRSLLRPGMASGSFDLFRGLPEDRYISAFLDPTPYLDEHGVPRGRDPVEDAIEVLRVSSLTTYENRRISTGVLLLDAEDRAGALAYNTELASIKSFHRLCGGERTVVLVNRAGLLVDLVDIREWSREHASGELPVPSAAAYRSHALATLKEGRVCLVLTGNGEIKIFARGSQKFNFMEGRWRLTDASEQYALFRRSMGDASLAESLFTAALNLAEARRGALFVVLDDPASAAEIVSPPDMMNGAGAQTGPGKKERIHYLLLGKRTLGMPPAVLESIAGMDGAVVVDRASNLLAFGAIVKHNTSLLVAAGAIEGGRTNAAVAASMFGCALKVSEDGLVSFFQKGLCVWEL
ncbi:MAG: hypothetical protein EXQ52_08185 [Bryobacterales bacterium]|nr:hypothetical protein [Bryobacterales bacterium]